MRTLLRKQHEDLVHKKLQPTDYKHRHKYNLHLTSQVQLDMNTI